MKSGFVSIVGKTNVGKSSIINSLVGEKVAAIANRPQTTRKAIKAIVNRPDSQIIFIDTPGIHKPQSKLSDAMIETSLTSIQDVDLIVFVVEAFAKEISEEEKIILEKDNSQYGFISILDNYLYFVDYSSNTKDGNIANEYKTDLILKKMNLKDNSIHI